MLAVLAPIVVFGIVIFVHELGHFLAAKSVGVYAPRFSIGFGPALWRRRHGETEYVLAAFPLGGYVRMASRLDNEAASLEGGSEEAGALKEGDRGYDPEAMIPFGPRDIPENRWFESKPLWARLMIMIAGVTMNILLAIVVAIGLALAYGKQVVDTTVVGGVRPLAGAPALAQLQQGDSIRAVNGKAVRSWNEVMEGIAESRDVAEIRTQRGVVRVPVGGSGAPDAEALLRAISFHVPAVIDTLEPGFPAAKAGLRRGDSVVAIGGQPVRSWTDLQRLVGASPGKAVEFTVARAGGTQRISVVPDSQTAPDPATGAQRVVGKVGMGPRELVRTERVPPGEAVVTGWTATWEMAGAIVNVVKRLATREVSVRQLGGPIAITQASVAAAQSGLEHLLYLIALLSVNVAVLNLLPIPILDGGQILLNVIESAKGSPFSVKTRDYILRVGIAAIMALFVLVMFNDIRGLVTRFLG